MGDSMDSSGDRHRDSEALPERVKELEEDLAASRLRETRLRQVLDLVPEFLFCVDCEGRVLLANKALAPAFGKSLPELDGALVTDVDPDADRGAETLGNCCEAMRSNAPFFRPERRTVDVNGNPLVLQTTSTPYVAADTGKPAILGVSVNITERIRLQTELMRSRHALIFGLAKLAESRDDDTGRHLERISKFSEILAVQLAKTNPDIDEEWIHTISITAALHDIGKVGIPDAVLLKPGPLTDEERKIMQRHTYIGGDTLMEIKHRWQDDLFVVTSAQIALGHHERWDGGGYPYGLAGCDIPLASRLVALADVYDALTSKRVYKPAAPHEKVRDIIAGESGSHFDPTVVEAFLAVESEFGKVARTGLWRPFES